MPRILATAFGLVFASFLAMGLIFAEPPTTTKKIVTDDYHGFKVADPYRWLEDQKDSGVRQWMLDQNQNSRTVLDNLPGRRAIINRIKQLYDTKTYHYSKMTYHEGNLFALSGGALVVVSDLNNLNSEIVIVDPEDITGNKTADIDFFVVSPDAKHVAVSISVDGKQDGTVYVVETRTGKKLEDKLLHVCSALGGSLAWNHDGSGFYYTRNSKGSRRPVHEPGGHEQIYFHKLGDDPAQDRYEFGKDFHPISGTVLETSPKGQYLRASVTTGWTSDTGIHYLLTPSGKWIPLNKNDDRVMAVNFGEDGQLWVLSRKDAPRGKILRLNPEEPDLKKAELIVSEDKGVIEGYAITKSKLFVTDRLDGGTRVRVFDHKGKEEKGIKLPPFAHVEELLALSNDEVLYQYETYLTPTVYTRYDAATGKSEATALDGKYPNADFGDSEVVRELVTSKDGTQVPLTILRRKDLKHDSNNPVLLEGYGGYGSHLTPDFSPIRRVWLEKGGVFAFAHIRGDGEFGEDWHQAGLVRKKQNTFDDFYACARFLIDQKYTKPELLAIEGGSNGGTLVGVALVQQPQLFRAVVAQSGNYDTLRQELHSAGRFDIPEFGTVKVKEEFEALYSYSPYHQTKDGTAYPSVLIVCGENDPRVDPADSRKFAAKLQAASSSKNPVLLLTRLKSGHSCVSFEEELDLQGDKFAFLFDQLGVPYKPNRKPKP